MLIYRGFFCFYVKKELYFTRYAINCVYQLVSESEVARLTGYLLMSDDNLTLQTLFSCYLILSYDYRLISRMLYAL